MVKIVAASLTVRLAQLDDDAQKKYAKKYEVFFYLKKLLSLPANKQVKTAPVNHSSSYSSVMF